MTARKTPRQDPRATATEGDTLTEMVDTLRALRILARAARRRAGAAARAGHRAGALRFTAHARLLSRTARAMQIELQRVLGVPVAA
jgi:NAD(P)H-hydrate repair Nnr-like enzyme with NAD(P)H-hydrate dehydratase domain